MKYRPILPVAIQKLKLEEVITDIPQILQKLIPPVFSTKIFPVGLTLVEFT
jgi:hypothetical protein